MNSSDKSKLGVIIIVFTLLFIYLFFASRTTYSSEEEMKSNLQGTYYYSYYLGNEYHYLEVKGNFLIDYLKIGESGSKKEIDKITKWNYRTGSFCTETGGKYIVNDDGDIKFNKTIFTNIKKTLFNKDYVRTIPYSSPTSYDYETKRSVLKISIEKVNSDSNYSFCTGSIKNEGKKEFKYLKVEGDFKDRNEKIIDADWTYVAYQTGLAPEETVKFELKVDKNDDIETCSVFAYGYDE